MMMGKRPYIGRSRREIRDHIFQKQVQVKKYDLPEGWSFEAADFINKLLQRKPANRLGLNGPEEVKSHIWLKDTDWDSIIKKQKVSPYIPNKDSDNFDAFQANAVDKWNEENQELLKKSALLLKDTKIQEQFQGYHYNQDSDLKPIEKPKRPTTVSHRSVKKHRKTFSLRW
mmetsp:Transcript_17926/g.20087  ORF Transcript_17926/g.20087 Transcript_17926/m.20087 type:complete len:171 (-) Transcript_17926:17-529(-)